MSRHLSRCHIAARGTRRIRATRRLPVNQRPADHGANGGTSDFPTVFADTRLAPPAERVGFGPAGRSSSVRIFTGPAISYDRGQLQ